MKKRPSIIVLSGASGAGKTTLLKKLSTELNSQLNSHSVCTFHFDSIGVPSVEEMNTLYGSPREWQRAMTDRWINKLIAETANNKLIFLEGQIDLEFIESAFKKYGFTHYLIVLVHCDDTLRHERLLRNRNQPELINPEMDNWARYLQKQALDKQIEIIDSSLLNYDEMLTRIMHLINNE